MNDVAGLKECIYCGTTKTSRWYGVRCVACYLRIRRENDPSRYRGYDKTRYTRNGGADSVRLKRQNQATPEREKTLAQGKARRAKVPRLVTQLRNRDHYIRNTQSIRDDNAAYKRRNKPKEIARHRRRFADMVLSLPKWVDKNALVALYRGCSVMHSIDHIIPLSHESVSGLTVLWNLQSITKLDNAVKNDSFDGTSDNESWLKVRAAHESLGLSLSASPTTRVKLTNWSHYLSRVFATPKWAVGPLLDDINALKDSCEPNEVMDHIIPLEHPGVCGLNLPCNLQKLSIQDNGLKSNQFDGTNENNMWRRK